MQKVNWRRLAVGLSAIGLIISSIGAAPNQVSALPKTGRALTVTEMMKTQGRGYGCYAMSNCANPNPGCIRMYASPPTWEVTTVVQRPMCGYDFWAASGTCNSSILFCTYNNYYSIGCPDAGGVSNGPTQGGTQTSACGV